MIFSLQFNAFFAICNCFILTDKVLSNFLGTPWLYPSNKWWHMKEAATQHS